MPGISPLLQQTTGVRPVRGEGVWLHGDDGRAYLDFTSGIGVTSTGHCHPRVVEAVREQAGRLLHGQYTTVLHPALPELVDRLVEVLPDGIDSVFLASAGTEAAEAALRLARHATGRTNVVVFDGGFHGRTAGAASMTTSKLAVRAGLEPLVSGVVVAPFPHRRHRARHGWSREEAEAWCLDELDHLLATRTAPDETAAVVVEPVLGEGGYEPVGPTLLAGLRARCDAHGMLLVADEIQTGVGRTGRFWGMEHAGVRPDVVLSAKGLASGLPLSAMAAGEQVMARALPGSQGGTYGANPLACAAALATLEVVAAEGLVANAAEQGERLLTGLQRAVGADPRVAEVRGRGLMVAVELVDGDGRPDGAAAGRLVAACEERGLLLLTCGSHGHVVRLVPPLVLGAEHADRAVEVVGEALAAL